MTAHAFPVVEVFGPVVQGEGPDAGLPCHFVRLGGCDFRCSWCDSMYAVDPAMVREAPKLTTEDIVGAVRQLGSPKRVILSGGNPALHSRLDRLVDALRYQAYKVAIETQGTVWRDWIAAVDRIVVSPKPPSSGMAARSDRQLPAFMEHAAAAGRSPTLKVVVFDEADYEWAAGVFARFPGTSRFLSAGTDIAAGDLAAVRAAIGDRYAWLCELAAGDPRMRNVRLLPQLHAVAFGMERGR